MLRPFMKANKKRARKISSISFAVLGLAARSTELWYGAEILLLHGLASATSYAQASTWVFRVYLGGPQISADSMEAIPTTKASESSLCGGSSGAHSALL